MDTKGHQQNWTQYSDTTYPLTQLQWLTAEPNSLVFYRIYFPRNPIYSLTLVGFNYLSKSLQYKLHMAVHVVVNVYFMSGTWGWPCQYRLLRESEQSGKWLREVNNRLLQTDPKLIHCTSPCIWCLRTDKELVEIEVKIAVLWGKGRYWLQNTFYIYSHVYTLFGPLPPPSGQMKRKHKR
jgi:hypothetical protein